MKTSVKNTNVTDYYPFGMEMPGRTYSTPSYRYGFQGQEKIDEVHNTSGSYLDYKYRGYDSRIGRFTSEDPLAKKYAYNSPYAFSENRVVDAVELEGLEMQLIQQKLQGAFDAMLKLTGFDAVIESTGQNSYGPTAKAKAVAEASVPVVLAATGLALTIATGGGFVAVGLSVASVTGTTLNLVGEINDNSTLKNLPSSVTEGITVTVTYMIGAQKYTKQIVAVVSIVEGVLTLNTKSLGDLYKNAKSAEGVKDIGKDVVTILEVALTVSETPQLTHNYSSSTTLEGEQVSSGTTSTYIKETPVSTATPAPIVPPVVNPNENSESISPGQN